MSRALGVAITIAAVALTAVVSSRYAGRSPDAAAAALPASPNREETLAAEAYVVAPATVAETARTVGTLAANESVVVVAEISRRLVTVHVEEGTTVDRGALLFELDDADLRATLAELEVRHRLAVRTEQRQHALLALDKKALSQQAYDQAVAARDTVEAEIAALRVTLDKTEIRAPFRARAGLRRVSEGAWITPETTLITLQDTSHIKIDFTLPERHAGAVRIGQPFSFEVAGHAQPFVGKVTAIEPAIDAATRSLLVRGMTENPGDVLLPGAFASVEIAVAEEKESIVVPAQAIVPAAAGHAVFLLRDGRAVLQEIEIGARTRDSVQVRRGLAVGDTVLTSNLLRLRSGVRVEVARPG